ncbi:hypothetical protein acsn021_17250 [Anaerocolumna cellulosilytica]|uniref:Uncharacterized protein n=1 Tax=Anaerocolumna cellulosilytica TaxID=433286 RepID=A0A6S6QWQ3_9FIRM|nr:acyl carrier protein [Anaerocolumna cellulosilytica]MBB5194881.1 acyl carrier protein [Anaerocolumna cellulosilytica]BCJ94156.1 hypothetical protein acsn021_17250 [Anaerocolumna cellulosilytica]
MSNITNYTSSILKIIANVMDIEESTISLDKTFEEIGLGSLGFINIIVQCETEFDIEFGEDKFLISEFPQITDFVSYVESLIQ